MKPNNNPESQKRRLGDIDWERPRLDDPLYKENPQPHGFGMDPIDGLPAPQVMSTFSDAEAADLTPDRFVCMAGAGRRQCSYYRRQLLPSAMDKNILVCIRYCSAIHTENGEMMDLGNTEVLACEFRDPPDSESLKRLEVFDAELLRRQEERRNEEAVFDPLKALGEVHDSEK
jgi:hypothetical protein